MTRKVERPGRDLEAQIEAIREFAAAIRRIGPGANHHRTEILAGRLARIGGYSGKETRLVGIQEALDAYARTMPSRPDLAAAGLIAAADRMRAGDLRRPAPGGHGERSGTTGLVAAVMARTHLRTALAGLRNEDGTGQEDEAVGDHLEQARIHHDLATGGPGFHDGIGAGGAEAARAVDEYLERSAIADLLGRHEPDVVIGRVAAAARAEMTLIIALVRDEDS